MHCLLLVPSRRDRLDEALASGATLVAADLAADHGSPDDRRACAGAWLREARAAPSRSALYARIQGLAHDGVEADLDALCLAAPDGILLPNCRSARDVQRLGAKLAVREADHGLPDGGIGILAVVASSAAAVLALGTFAGASSRLRGLVWDASALARDLGIAAAEDPAPLRHARSLTILAARAAGVPAIDAAPAGADAVVVRACARGRRDGFFGALTTDAAQARLIASAYGRRDATSADPAR